jgi:hypothetical protein
MPVKTYGHGDIVKDIVGAQNHGYNEHVLES